MNPKSPDREELPVRDRRWVEALRAQAPDGPPPALDTAVLAAARAAVGAPAAAPTGRGSGAPRWLAAVAGVMVVLSAGVLVRQVAQETAPLAEPEIPVSPQGAAEARADAAMRATREAEGLPAAEAAPTDEFAEAMPAEIADAMPAEIADAMPAAAAPKSSAAAEVANSAERAIGQQAAAAPGRLSAPPSPPPEPPAMQRAEPAPEPPAPPAPPAPPIPVADFAPSVVRPLAESAPAPAALSAPEHGFAAKSAQADRRQKAEAGREAAAVTEPDRALPEPETLAEVRRLLADGDRDAAREALADWRQRHPAVELPVELAALLGDGE
jgi:hypothetical protein